tara:strand:- start:2749 stop:2931 length:183 start_codon:yes stop_codon:yes gene_type:complete
MSKKDFDKFLNKIEQLNLLVKLINKCPNKKEELIECKSHKDVIKLTNSWGFEIGNRWGEY